MEEKDNYRKWNKNCRDCVYFFGINDPSCTCNYIFMEGHSRGCPPGDECTVKVKRKRKRRMQSDRMKEAKEAKHG